MSPGITIVIPVHNRASLVCRTLESVAAQTWRPLSVIVVDNNSDDNTRQVVERWIAANALERSLDIRCVEESRPGAAAARNRGLSEVETEWTMFFDSDDEMLPRHVERAANCIDANPNIDIAGWDVSQQFADGTRRTGTFTTTDMQRANLIHGIMSTQRYMARTELFRRVGAWDDTVMVWNDWELGIRLLGASPRCMKITGEPTVIMYFTAESITGTRRIADRCLHTLNVAETDLKRLGESRLLKWIDYRHVVLAAECVNQGDAAEGRQIMNYLCAGKSLGKRLQLRLAYLWARTVKRGTYLWF